MKKMIAAVMCIAIAGLMSSGIAWAADDQDLDSLMISVTPNIDYGVDIDTGNVSLNLGIVDLYTSTQTVEPATVTILGSWYQQELDFTGSIEGGATDWTFDATPSTWAYLGVQDEIAVYALFTETSKVDAPTGDDFANGTADAGLTGATQAVGGASGDGDKFEYQGDSVEMDDMAVDAKSHLWIFLRLPFETSTNAEQDITLTLTASAAN